MTRLSVTQKHTGLVEAEAEFEGLDEGADSGLDEAWYFDTENALVKIENDYDWNGSNNVSRTTDSEFDHETLYVTAKGRYALRFTSNYQSVPDKVTELDVKQVVNWLIKNETDPRDYKAMPKEVAEEFERREG